MNAIFTVMVLKTKDDSPQVEIGLSSGAGFFEPLQTTRVFLSKDSIKAAKLFEDKDELPIIGNEKLTKALDEVAAKLADAANSVNKGVRKNIQKESDCRETKN